jgi:hypothetical protein
MLLDKEAGDVMVIDETGSVEGGSLGLSPASRRIVSRHRSAPCVSAPLLVAGHGIREEGLPRSFRSSNCPAAANGRLVSK